ncbi:phosphatase [Kushneria pakistanensis]|uniref:Phosphatase n=1 Tax=Kushneria pakistanensis TaxID=1508770 RepID=A0ABQ3FA14_9GAMM|nr:PHP domain-containing protein [Kushneria pakistanensis]GHC15386.1 phosphatase [Kushneria pakistanensis]
MNAQDTTPSSLAPGSSSFDPGMTLEQACHIDLHLHSTASDGRLSPQELMRLCHHRGLSCAALTDHDTIDGVEAAAHEARALGMTLVPGAELSTRWQGVGIHVVAMWHGQAQAPMTALLERLAQARHDRALEIATRLEKAGLDNALERAREQSPGARLLGRPDFARALVAAGLVPDMTRAFKRYLGAGKTGDVKVHWPTLEETLESVRRAGGVAVVAHPLRYGLTRRRLGLLLDEFAALGGEGAELISGYQNDNRSRDLVSLLDKRGLYASLGSDFHYPGGALAPGTLSAAPRSQLLPIWQHPRLAPAFERP